MGKAKIREKALARRAQADPDTAEKRPESQRLFDALVSYARDAKTIEHVLELGRAYLELGRFDDAAYVSTTASGDDVEVLKAEIFFGREDYNEALAIYRELYR